MRAMWWAFQTTARLRIGDTLTEGESLVFQGVPNFAPEILRRVRLEDAMKAKKLKEALQQMAEEGVVQLFSPEDGSPAIVGVVGALQLDVLKERLSGEYGLPVSFEMARFSVCRWISADNHAILRSSSPRSAAISAVTSMVIRSLWRRIHFHCAMNRSARLPSRWSPSRNITPRRRRDILSSLCLSRLLLVDQLFVCLNLGGRTVIPLAAGNPCNGKPIYVRDQSRPHMPRIRNRIVHRYACCFDPFVAHD